MKSDDRISCFAIQTRRGFLLTLAGAGLVLLTTRSADARRGRGRGGRDRRDEDQDYDQAREAVDTGAALPLSEILVEVRKVIEGDVLDVELMREGAAISYRIRVLTPKGDYYQVLVDAKTKSILKIEQQ